MTLLHELNGYRAILRLMIVRDLRMRYAGSLLGMTWNLIHPLLMVAIYILVIGAVMGLKTGHVGQRYYSIHICAGIIPWMLFAEVLTRSSTVLLENANFLRKLSFPAIILPLSVFLNALLLYGTASVFLVLMLFVLQIPVGGFWTLYFFVLVAVGLFALGLGLFLSVLNVYFRDLGQVLAIFLSLFFWLNPIVYYKEQLGDGLLLTILEANPFHHFITAAQAACHVATAPTPEVIPLLVVLPIGTLILGYRFFEAQRRAVLDEL